MPWNVEEAGDLIQRWLRCGEECMIVERELCDMVVFCTHRIGCLRSRGDSLDAHVATLGLAMEGGAPAGQSDEDDPVALALWKAFRGRRLVMQQNQYKQVALRREGRAILAGKVSIIMEEAARLQRLLCTAESAHAHTHKSCLVVPQIRRPAATLAGR